MRNLPRVYERVVLVIVGVFFYREVGLALQVEIKIVQTNRSRK